MEKKFYYQFYINEYLEEFEKINWKLDIVKIDKFTVLLKLKKVDDTIAGIINKIIKGFVTPPVKKRSKES